MSEKKRNKLDIKNKRDQHCQRWRPGSDIGEPYVSGYVGDMNIKNGRDQYCRDWRSGVGKAELRSRDVNFDWKAQMFAAQPDMPPADQSLKKIVDLLSAKDMDLMMKMKKGEVLTPFERTKLLADMALVLERGGEQVSEGVGEVIEQAGLNVRKDNLGLKEMMGKKYFQEHRGLVGLYLIGRVVNREVGPIGEIRVEGGRVRNVGGLTTNAPVLLSDGTTAVGLARVEAGLKAGRVLDLRTSTLLYPDQAQMVIGERVSADPDYASRELDLDQKIERVVSSDEVKQE